MNKVQLYKMHYSKNGDNSVYASISTLSAGRVMDHVYILAKDAQEGINEAKKSLKDGDELVSVELLGDMNEVHDDRVEFYKAAVKDIKNSHAIQGSEGNWNHNEYMFGMFNGIEHSLAILENRDPEFRGAPESFAPKKENKDYADVLDVIKSRELDLKAKSFSPGTEDGTLPAEKHFRLVKGISELVNKLSLENYWDESDEFIGVKLANYFDDRARDYHGSKL